MGLGTVLVSFMFLSMCHAALKPVKPSVVTLKPTCCVPGIMTLSLTGSGSYTGSVAGLSTPTFTPGTSSQNKCNVGALIKANFQKLDDCSGCQNAPDCGRRMLQFDMYMPGSRGGWTFNVGDSQSNNGYGGDSGHQDNDAEIHGLNNNIYLYKGDRCLKTPAYSKTYFNAVASSVTHIRVYVSNNYMRVQNNNGLDVELCDKCLYALNGQSDSGSLGPNEDVFVAINRVVSGSWSRRGYGVCRATLQWACPWNHSTL